MKPTEVLKTEHEAIKLMLRILNGICDRLESGKDVDPQHLEQTLEFIRVFADKCHHGKEEDLLFPAMERAGVPREGGPISVMLVEHNQGRDYVKGMNEAFVKYKAGDHAAAAKFVENARNYVALLTQHIDKEDNILYMIADMHLPRAMQEEMVEEFEKLELERIGLGKHEEFHETLHRLQEVYLK
jgi:hemerythrin-like domain-containing protein